MALDILALQKGIFLVVIEAVAVVLSVLLLAAMLFGRGGIDALLCVYSRVRAARHARTA